MFLCFLNNNLTNNICTNLLNPTLETSSQNGITCTNNGDGTYTLNGTATDTIDFNLTSSLNLVNGKAYLLSFPSPSRVVRAYLLNGQDAVEAYSNHLGVFKYIGETSSNKVVHLLIEKGYTCNNLIIKPMLTTNLSATYDDFVSYTGNTGRLNADVALLNNNKGINVMLDTNTADIEDIFPKYLGRVIYHTLSNINSEPFRYCFLTTYIWKDKTVNSCSAFQFALDNTSINSLTIKIRKYDSNKWSDWKTIS